MLLLGGVVVLDGCICVPLFVGGTAGAAFGLLCCVPLLSVEVAAGEVAAPGTLDGCGVAGEATLPEVPDEPGEVVVVWAAAPVAPEIPPAAAGAVPAAAFAGPMFCPIAVPLTTSSTRRFS